MDNDVFDEDDIPDDIDDMDYMISEAWFSELDNLSAALYLKNVLNKMKTDIPSFYSQLISVVNETEQNQLSSLIDNYEKKEIEKINKQNSK